MEIVEIQLKDGTWVPLSPSVTTPSVLCPMRTRPVRLDVASTYSVTRAGQLQVTELEATSLGSAVDTHC